MLKVRNTTDKETTMKIEKNACTCHRDGTCKCGDMAQHDDETGLHCAECDEYGEHCACGCTCTAKVQG